MAKGILLFVFLLLVSSYQIGSTAPQYIVFIIMVLMAITGIIAFARLPKLDSYLDCFPLLMLLTWLYGVVLGVINGNELKYIVSNFAGMSVYAAYYIFILYKIKRKSLFNVVLWACVVNIFYVLASVVYTQFLHDFQLPVFGVRYYYSVGVCVITPIISLLIAEYIWPRKSIGLLTKNTSVKGGLFVLGVFAFAVFTLSKGFFAALLFIILMYLVVILTRLLLTFKITKTGGILVAIVIVIVMTGVSTTSVNDKITFAYSSQQSGNAIRTEQGAALIDEFLFFGNGLGAGLKSGYSRDRMGYGFELTYHNLIHKVGLIAVIPFSIYVFCILYSLYGLTMLKNTSYSALALGSLMFVVPSYGNPILFSPVVVILHCLSIYWLRGGIENKKGIGALNGMGDTRNA